MSSSNLQHPARIFRTIGDGWALHCPKHGLVPLPSKVRPPHDVECPSCVADREAKRA